MESRAQGETLAFSKQGTPPPWGQEEDRGWFKCRLICRLDDGKVGESSCVTSIFSIM